MKEWTKSHTVRKVSVVNVMTKYFVILVYTCTCCTGHELINDLISVFLFSASKLICSEGYSGRGIVDINPRCTDLFSRVAAFDLIVELCSGCYDNLVLAASQLINLHHVENPDMAKEWEVCDVEWVCDVGCVMWGV